MSEPRDGSTRERWRQVDEILELALETPLADRAAEDQARLPVLDKVIELGGRAQDLSPLSRLAVEFARKSRLQDDAGVAQAKEALGTLPMEGQDLLYVRTRLAMASLTIGEPETGVPMLEWIVEKWPQDAAAPKALADHYLGGDEPVSLELAVRHGNAAGPWPRRTWPQGPS